MHDFIMRVISIITLICLLAPSTLALLRIRFIVVLLLPEWFALNVTLSRVSTTIYAAARRLTMSATLARTHMMLTSSVRLFRLFHLHLSISHILLSGKWNPVLFLKFTQHMLSIALLRVYLSTPNDLLNLLNQNWSFLVIWNFESTLHNIVGKLIVNHSC